MTAPARSQSPIGDLKARDLARDLAREAGLSLEQWLEQASKDDRPHHPTIEELGRVTEALDRLSTRIETAEHRSMLAINGIDQSVVGLLSRLEGAERDQAEAVSRVDDELRRVRDEQARAQARMARIEAEAASAQPLEAVRSLESAMGKVAAHVYDSDHRAQETIDGLRGDFGQLARRVEEVDARAAELARSPIKQIDDVVGRIVRRLEQAEARTSGAIGSLETSFADLDQRLRNTELRNDGPEQRLEQLAADLAQSFEDTRAELAANLAASADGRLDALERSLKEMSEHVGSAERRSTKAIEAMGHEVLRMADTLGRRMEGVENRSAQAMQAVGGEVARIADTVEARFRRADQIQAEALEKLGSEIGRISERLADRIASSERRAAQAIDDVSEQVARVTEKIGQRSERSSEDIAERIRQSEARTAKLLEEAREKIDQRLADTQRRLAEPAPRHYAEEELFSAPDLAPGPFGPDAFADPGFDDGPAARPRADTAPPAAEAVDRAFEAPAAFEPEPFQPEPFGRASDEPEAAPTDVFGGAFEKAPPVRPESPRSSTRELIEQARAAARAAQVEPRAQPKPAGGLFSGLSLPKRKPKSSSAKTAVMMSATAAALGISAFGYTMISAQSVKDREAAAEPVDATATPPAGVSPMAAIAVGPQIAAPASPSAVTAPTPEAMGLYAEAVRRIEAKDHAAVADLRRAANLGHGQAQFYLAKLYEGGEAGLVKDLAEARRWTERAAQNGDRKAMHNLGLYYFEGAGGPKNATAAAQWFRRAADLGLLDSQFNLARLYEEGFGVGRNPAEAYKWYLVGGRSGDGESRAAAHRVRSKLSPQARIAGERAAAAFRPETPRVVAAITVAPAAVTSNADVSLAQRALSRLGYYRGPQDGAKSPALGMAIQAYQRDNGLPATGAVDSALAARFVAVSG